MDQNYLNEYLASVNGDSSLTNDSKTLIQKHIAGLFAFAQSRQANESNQNPVNKSGNPAVQEFDPNYPNQPQTPNQTPSGRQQNTGTAPVHEFNPSRADQAQTPNQPEYNLNQPRPVNR